MFFCLFTTAYFLGRGAITCCTMVHILHQGFQFYILYNLASLRVWKIRFALLYRNPQIKTFEFRNFRIFSESFRNSKWFAWFPGQITIDRIIIISHDFLMTFSDLLKFWPFFSYLSPQVLLHSDWSKRASHKITRHTSFIRDVSNSALTNSKTRYVSRFSHFSRFSSMATWSRGVTWWTGDYRLHKQYRTQRMLYNEPQN